MNVAYDLLNDLAVIGATLRPAGDRLMLRAGRTAIPAELVHRVREAKVDLIATLAGDEAHGACIVNWLNQHPASSAPGRCAWCGRSESPSAVVLPFGTEPGTHAWLHADCWPAWHQSRRREAVLALRGMGITMGTNAAKQLPSDEPPAKPVEPPAEAPQPETETRANNGIPQDRRGFVGYVDGRFVHYCPECGEWGAHGIGVFLRRGQLGVWYCAEHKPKR